MKLIDKILLLTPYIHYKIPPFPKGGSGGIRETLINTLQYPRGILKDFPSGKSKNHEFHSLASPIPGAVFVPTAGQSRQHSQAGHEVAAQGALILGETSGSLAFLIRSEV
jgi:hypothetical protein